MRPLSHLCGLTFIEFPQIQLLCLIPSLRVLSVSHECSLIAIIPSMVHKQFHLFLCPLFDLLD